MYELRLLAAAERALARLDRETAVRITKRTRWLAENLDAIQPEALKGQLSDLYKRRVGDYRLFYQVLRNERVIIVVAIGHRREVYR